MSVNKPPEPHYDRGRLDSIDGAMVLIDPGPSDLERCRTTRQRGGKRGPPGATTVHMSHTSKLFAMQAIIITLADFGIVQTPRRRTLVETQVYPLCVGVF